MHWNTNAAVLVGREQILREPFCFSTEHEKIDRAEISLRSKGTCSLSSEKNNSHPATATAAGRQKNPRVSGLRRSNNRDLPVSIADLPAKSRAA